MTRDRSRCPPLPTTARRATPLRRRVLEGLAGRTRLAPAACALLLTTSPLAAQTLAPATGDVPAGTAAGTVATDPDPVLSLEQLLDVEVESVFGASKALQKVTEAPASVTVVTADDIERYGWRTLADVLRNVRGFYVTDDRSWAYVGTRGFLRPGDYSTRILLTLDGHRLNDNVFDQALIQEDFQVDLRTVERIEVVRGAGSSLYGSNAFFGVVNVVTREGTAGSAAETTVDAGSLGQAGGHTRLRHTFENGLGLSLAAAGEDRRGVRALYFPEYDSPASGDGVARNRDRMRRRSVFARADYGGLALRGGYNARTKYVPTGAYGAVFNEHSSVLDEHAMADGTWAPSLGGGWTGLFRGAYDHYAFTGSHPFASEGEAVRPFVRYIDRAVGRWVTGEAQLSRTVMRRHQFTAGVEHRTNVGQHQFSHLDGAADLLWEDRRTSSTTGVYVQDQVRLHARVLVNAGLRYDRYSHFANPLKPRVAAILQPRSDTTVKLMYGAAFRAPNVYESYYEIPGQWKARPGLQPEEVQTVEAVVEHYAGRRVRLSANVFSYAVSRLIDFTSTPDGALVYYDNLGAARSSGVEGEAEARWPGGVHARASYTYANARDEGTGERLSNSPRHVGQGLFSAPLGGGAFAALDVQWLGARLTRSGARLAGYVRPSVTITGPQLHRVRLAATVTNLTAARYADPVGDDFVQDAVLQNGRTLRVQATWSFR